MKKSQTIVVDESKLYNANYDKEEFAILIQQYQIYINYAEVNSTQRFMKEASDLLISSEEVEELFDDFEAIDKK